MVISGRWANVLRDRLWARFATDRDPICLMSPYEIGFPLFKLELIGGQFLNRKESFPDPLRSVYARPRRDVIPVVPPGRVLRSRT